MDIFCLCLQFRDRNGISIFLQLIKSNRLLTKQFRLFFNVYKKIITMMVAAWRCLQLHHNWVHRSNADRNIFINQNNFPEENVEYKIEFCYTYADLTQFCLHCPQIPRYGALNLTHNSVIRISIVATCNFSVQMKWKISELRN